MLVLNLLHVAPPMLEVIASLIFIAFHMHRLCSIRIWCSFLYHNLSDYTVYVSHFNAVGTSEFQKRAEKYISESEKHVFRPLVMRCLEKHPEARWTFEEVMAHLNKYSKREQAQIVEEGNVRPLMSLPLNIHTL